MTQRTSVQPTAARGVEGLDGSRTDVLIVGGGILGAGVAAELSRRGHSCLLVEQVDFGHGTTARSTRLIHGGLRYLVMFDLGLVREGLRERSWQLREMPNLVRPLGLMLVHYDEPAWRRARARFGLSVYDLLSPSGSLPRHRHLSRTDALAMEPALRERGLQGAELFWDGQVELPERLVIEVLRRASEAGADVRNYVAAIGLRRRGGRARAVELLDLRTNQHATVAVDAVINASGPWADVTLRQLGIERAPLLRLSQGIHLVYPRLSEHAIAFEHPRDGRLCFAIPWQDATMVGTTDTDVDGPPEAARIRPEDVSYLAQVVDRHFSRPVAPMWASVGVRSLARDGEHGSLPQSVSRHHVLVDHVADGAQGLFTLAGGKLTAWRATGEFVANRLEAGMPNARRTVASSASPDRTPPRWDTELPERLWRLYGVRAGELNRWIEADPWWAEPVLPGGEALRAEVAHAFAQEWAVTLADVVLRRLALGFGPDLGERAASAMAAICQARLGWSDDRVERELGEFRAQNLERRLPSDSQAAAA